MECCPICLRQFTRTDIQMHVNFCLDQSQSQLQFSNDVNEASELPASSFALLDSVAIGNSARWLSSYGRGIEMLEIASRGGGLLFASVVGVQLQSNTQSYCTHSCLPMRSIWRSVKQRIQTPRVVHCRISFEEMSHITSATRLYDDGLFGCGSSELCLPVHDFFGPLPISIDVLSKTFIGTNRHLGVVHSQLRYAVRSEQRKRCIMSDVFSITDPEMIVKRLRNIIAKSSAFSPISRANINYRHLVEVLSSSSSQLDSITSSNNVSNLSTLAALLNEPKLLPCSNSSSCVHGVWADLTYFALDSMLADRDVENHHKQEENSIVNKSCNFDSTDTLPMMHLMVALGSRRLVDYAMEHGVYDAQARFCGRTAIHVAALLGHVDVLHELVLRDSTSRREELNIDFTIVSKPIDSDDHGRTALHYAVYGAALHERAEEIVNVLRSQNFNTQDDEGRSPLMLLCQLGLDNEVSLNQSSHIKLAQTLLSHGAHPLTCDIHGDTPLIAATKCRDVAMMQWLISVNSSCLNIYNNAGRHPLTVAAQSGFVQGIIVLLQANALPWASPIDGQTPLHVLATLGHVEALRIFLSLLSQTFSIAKLSELLFLRDHDGHIAHHVAAKGKLSSHHEIITLLEAYHRVAQDNGENEPSGSSFIKVAATDDEYVYFEDAQDAHDCRSSAQVSPGQYVENVSYASSEQENDDCELLSSSSSLLSSSNRCSASVVTHEVFEEKAAALEHCRQVTEVASVLQAMAHEDFTEKPSLLALEGPLHVPISTAASLLRHFRWDMNKLLSSFSGDAIGTCISAGITLRADPEHPATQTPFDRVEGSKEFICLVCMDTFRIDQGLALHCGHFFDTSCWRGHLSSKLADGPSCVLATCPDADCREIVHEDLWQKVFENDEDGKEQLNRYSSYLVHSYIELNPSLKWCPAPLCNKAVYHTGDETDLRCDCGFKMCFLCNEAAHSPANCDMMRNWRIKCIAGGRNAELILKTSRLCPQCGVAIQRISGCNHLRCTMCEYEFCWLCLNGWASHGDATGGFYECNQYDSTLLESNKNTSGTRRYVHFFTRYEHHLRARDISVKAHSSYTCQLASTDDEYTQLRLKHVLAALLNLIESRRVLAYSYVFAFYLPEPSPQHLFEHLQEMAEKHSEFLHSLIFPGVSSSAPPITSTDKIHTFTRLVNQFSNNLMQGVNQHFTKSSSVIVTTPTLSHNKAVANSTENSVVVVSTSSPNASNRNSMERSESSFIL